MIHPEEVECQIDRHLMRWHFTGSSRSDAETICLTFLAFWL